MLLDHIQMRPAQPAISFDDLRILLDVLSSAKNGQAVQSKQEELKQAAIV
jgi:hypothetical protein